MKFGICDIGLAPIRAEPSDKSEMTSQILYGESFSIVKKQLNWTFIKLIHDGYRGWIDNKQFREILKPHIKNIQQETLLPDLVDVVISSKKENIPIVCGAVVSNCKLLQHSFDRSFSPKKRNRPNIINSALLYLNAPYLWGGRSPFGIDCSGFTQMVYRLHGIPLPRDAKNQVKEGAPLSFIEESKMGDLAFFDNDQGEITHVGILMNSNSIIHASGKVRIDKIDHTGIYNFDLKDYTHKLRLIANFF